MTKRCKNANEAGGGDPAGSRPPKVVHSACMWLALHRKPSADLALVYDFALVFIAERAIPAFEEALRQDATRRYWTAWHDRQTRAKRKRVARLINRQPVRLRPILRACNAASANDPVMRFELQPDGTIGRPVIGERAPGNAERTAVKVLVRELAELWAAVAQPRGRTAARGGKPPREIFIKWACEGVLEAYRALPEALLSKTMREEVERQLAPLTHDAVAGRLKPSKNRRFLRPRN